MSEHEGKCYLDEVLFKEPSDNIRGIVTAFAVVKGKSKRVAFAHLKTDTVPSVGLDTVRGITLAELPAYAAILVQFHDHVAQLEREKA